MLNMLATIVVFLTLAETLPGWEITYRRVVRSSERGAIAYPEDLALIEPSHYHHHYPHSREFHSERFHGHSPEFHQYHHHHHPGSDYDFGGVDAVDRSASDNRDKNLGNDARGSGNKTVAIPIDFIRDINNYNVSELLLNFVEGVDDFEDEGKPKLQNRFGEDSEERNAAVLAKSAGCLPELRTVKLISSNDPSVLYIPQCTRVEQCGGCCSHPLLSCQPIESEPITYQVRKTQYTGARKLKFVGKEIVVVEKHTKCKCDCRIKKEDCNKYQEYRKSECRCVCMNLDEEKKCYKNNNTKLWNPDLCACQCRNGDTQCSTGYAFDQIECRCKPIPMKRRYVENERRGYKSEAVSVLPLFDDE